MSIIKENLQIANIHLNRLKQASKEIESKNILKDFDIDDFEVVKVIDTFVFRFIKLQDYLGQKLFRRFLEEIGELYENMSFIDILDKLEKLGIINSSVEWIEIRKLRNKLTHEYPDELEAIKEEINVAMNKISLLEKALQNIEDYLKNKKIL
ncbi:HepT-like ribonuclease domain-containing protein [Persephonella sp. KM09-Lau-8]|uniref:HepT-like ribonuclease domain-containing protein n=1 Tax=Persephonella sp. KM09-Lau-8 TaxID=1158345 RepID=UPI0004966B80|nr:HepT-like ribonuclease domain-containing protein [Persephonella sp. KM09-Lau-8]